VAKRQAVRNRQGFAIPARPPVALDSKEWTTDFNEIKDYGAQKSAKRTAQQTETARFWLTTGPVAYHPFVRQLVTAKGMDVVESARFMALAGIAINDALIAVLDAKYHYNFWRPVTAIRNGDIDDSPATDREATWQPIADTPMHPEYPCAHCIVSGSVAGVIKAALGTEEIPEIAMTSPTAPGVTHRWTNITALTEEVRFPLPLLDPRRDGDGAPDRRLRCEKRHAASRDGRTAAAAAAGPGSCCTITSAPPGS
jgi:hypothetical protein